MDNGCNIWNQDAYRWYLKQYNDYAARVKHLPLVDQVYLDIALPLPTLEIFVDEIKKSKIMRCPFNTSYKLGDLGKVYGQQWRNQNGIDQIKVIVSQIMTNPEGRYAILDAWNPVDFKEMALPPCHLLYQFNCRKMTALERENEYAEKHGFSQEIRDEMNPNDTDEYIHQLMDEDDIQKYFLDVQMYQRSCDVLLGVPFNIASVAVLLNMISIVTHTVPGKIIWVGGDTHIYENHMDQVKEQLTRIPTFLSKLVIPLNRHDFAFKFWANELTYEDFRIINYVAQDNTLLKGELNVGLNRSLM